MMIMGMGVTRGPPCPPVITNTLACLDHSTLHMHQTLEAKTECYF